jgi:hypothetical protein
MHIFVVCYDIAGLVHEVIRSLSLYASCENGKISCYDVCTQSEQKWVFRLHCFVTKKTVN